MMDVLAHWPAAATATVFAAIASAFAALLVSFRTAVRESQKRRSDISLDVTNLLLDPQRAAAAKRRFAVAILKVKQCPAEHQSGLVLFIPLNSRITIGRDGDNDLIFADKYISRFHCGLVSEGPAVFVEDYCSTNGVEVNGAPVPPGGSLRLEDGDTITLNSIILQFHTVHCSRILG